MRPTFTGYAANAGTTTITITTSENVSGAPDGSDFSLTVNGVSKTVSSVTVPGGTSVVLNLADAIPNDATVTLSYTQNSTDSKQVQDANDNAAVSVTVPQVVTVTNDEARPTVSSVTGVDGTYTAGDSTLITIAFSEAVVVTGTPTLELETGSSDAKATYASGSGSSDLVFTYLVGSGETASDLNYTGTDALSIVAENATIKDPAGNLAILTLPALDNSNALAETSEIVIA